MQLIPLLQTGAPAGQRTTLVAADPLVSFAAAFDKLAASDTAEMAPMDVDPPTPSDTARTESAEDDPTAAKTPLADVADSEGEVFLDSPPMPVGHEPPIQQAKTNADMPLRAGSETRLIYAVRTASTSQLSGGAAASDAGSDGAVALPAHTAKARLIVAHRETAELMMRPANQRADAPQTGAPASVRGPSHIAVTVEGMAPTAAATDMRETATQTDKTATVMRPTTTILADGLERASNRPVSGAVPAHGDGNAASAARQQLSPKQPHLPTLAQAVHQTGAPIPQTASAPTDAGLENQSSPPQTPAPQRPSTHPDTAQPTVARNMPEPKLAPTRALTAVPAAKPLADAAPVEGQVETALADIRTPGQTTAQPHIQPAQAAPQHLHATVAKQIADAVQNGNDRQIELTLSPAELGKVRMSLSTKDAGVSVMIHADRPETLDLMRRNIGDLESEFADMGYGDVDFAFSGGDGAHDQRDDHPQPHDTSTHAEAPVVSPASNVSGDTPLSSETSMDIRL